MSSKLEQAQKLSIYTIDDVFWTRVCYGEEVRDWVAEEQSCHDCGAEKDQFHVPGCDVERCPKCSMQAITCECNINELRVEGDEDGITYDEKINVPNKAFNDGLLEGTLEQRLDDVLLQLKAERILAELMKEGRDALIDACKFVLNKAVVGNRISDYGKARLLSAISKADRNYHE